MRQCLYDNFGRQLSCSEAVGLESLSLTIWLVIIVLFVIAGAVLLMAVLPPYRVWSSRKLGEADLAQANFEQKIQIAEAQARLDAAELNKRAAVIEAEAVAAQITTIGEHLRQHDLYLRWQWIEMMKHRDGETIYVPTEANLPVLESTRRISP